MTTKATGEPIVQDDLRLQLRLSRLNWPELHAEMARIDNKFLRTERLKFLAQLGLAVVQGDLSKQSTLLGSSFVVQRTVAAENFALPATSDGKPQEAGAAREVPNKAFPSQHVPLLTQAVDAQGNSGGTVDSVGGGDHAVANKTVSPESNQELGAEADPRAFAMRLIEAGGFGRQRRNRPGST